MTDCPFCFEPCRVWGTRAYACQNSRCVVEQEYVIFYDADDRKSCWDIRLPKWIGPVKHNIFLQRWNFALKRFYEK